ncbi:MAG: phosphoribosylanthranilate isomerase [Acetobacterales bacterium]
MGIKVKICGVNAPDALTAAVEDGADFVGFVFYPPSPRAVSREQAAELAAAVPDGIERVGLFVDPDDATLERVLEEASLDMIQLHGRESPERVAGVRTLTGRKVMKAIGVASAADLDAAAEHAEAADWLMFDARPPRDRKDALPGGNAMPFDWDLLRGRTWPVPWMLAGGLDAGNLAEAVRRSGAPAVDVSSGVEKARGRKDPALVRAFLAAARAL